MSQDTSKGEKIIVKKCNFDYVWYFPLIGQKIRYSRVSLPGARRKYYKVFHWNLSDEQLAIVRNFLCYDFTEGTIPTRDAEIVYDLDDLLEDLEKEIE